MTRAETDTEILADLLARSAAGDTAAFAEFYDRTSARVHGMVLRVLRDPGYSEETTQEVYLQVWRGAVSYRSAEGTPIAWLLSIAHRRAVDRVRSESSASRRDSDYGARELVDIGDAVGDEVQARDAGRRVRKCLGTLSALQAEAVGLAYYGGLSYSEVADRLTVGLPAIKSRIRDGLKRLRGCLENG
ncbi:ECF RNA polymerase sigma factor SigK [Gordonia humi]|uniref:RNA polymerase sigma-70 factor (ECF subfamily) n=1 Tax=Gordonia humi TaxID=686429 RepID=A0A840EX92_9ACTN|nr:RNA polymerase sigma-70 factor (ECF subfamily) [Gordonia humi]